MKIQSFTLFVLIAIASTMSYAVPNFFISTGPNGNGDLAWQAAVNNSFVEENFDSFSGGIHNSFVLGGVTVSMSLPNAGTNGMEIFTGGGYHLGGGAFGTLSGNALLNRNTASDNTIQFDFSQPVTGFGIWIFDDVIGQSADRITMTVNGVTSAVMDDNPNTNSYTVEGFISVVDTDGISSLTIQNINPSTSFFELDHMQLSTTVLVPEPSSFSIAILGIFALIIRRKFTC